jgi:hypothetical protein
MRFSLDNIHDRLVRYAEEQKRRHPPEEPARVRAGHWINWPLFLSQPLAPLVLYYFPTPEFIIPFVIAVVGINILWIKYVSRLFVSPTLSRLSDLFVSTKWISCPAIALLLFRAGHSFVGIFALLWPALLLPLLIALHRFWPPSALQKTQARLGFAGDH